MDQWSNNVHIYYIKYGGGHDNKLSYLYVNIYMGNYYRGKESQFLSRQIIQRENFSSPCQDFLTSPGEFFPGEKCLKMEIYIDILLRFAGEIIRTGKLFVRKTYSSWKINEPKILSVGGHCLKRELPPHSTWFMTSGDEGFDHYISGKMEIYTSF